MTVKGKWRMISSASVWLDLYGGCSVRVNGGISRGRVEWAGSECLRRRSLLYVSNTPYSHASSKQVLKDLSCIVALKHPFLFGVAHRNSLSVCPSSACPMFRYLQQICGEDPLIQMPVIMQANQPHIGLIYVICSRQQ